MSKTTENNETKAFCVARVRIRLIRADELLAWNTLVDEKHYLSSRLVGPTLRYIAEVDGEWVGLLSFGQGSYHLHQRDRFIGWTDVQRGRRLSLLAQNTRFVLLHKRGQYPNLASRILSIVNKRLSADWQQQFGSPVVAVETFVDPEYFQGTCYRASGWRRLGETAGYARSRKDFYQEHIHSMLRHWSRSFSCSRKSPITGDSKGDATDCTRS